jgi:hypothetical protein
MKKGCWFLSLLVLLPSIVFAQNVIAVADFTTEEKIIATKMAGVTDIFRNELVKSSMVALVDRKHHEQIMAELRLQNSGITNPNSAKAVGELLNADYLIFGTVTRLGETSITDSTNVLAQVFGLVAKLGVTTSVVAQMVDVETGQIVASSQLSAATWNDYTNKIGAFAQSFIGKMGLPDLFTGKWEATLEHDGYEDVYEITFKPGNRCSFTVSSYDSKNVERTQTGNGTYTYGGEVLSMNVNFRKGSIPYLTKIDWRVMIGLNADKSSFNIVVPVSSQAGAKRVRATFWRSEGE